MRGGGELHCLFELVLFQSNCDINELKICLSVRKKYFLSQTVRLSSQ